MWTLAISLMIAQIVVLVFVGLSWVLQPHWMRKMLMKHRVPAGTILWVVIFLLTLAAMDHGFACGLIVATTTVGLTTIGLKVMDHAYRKAEDSVSRNKGTNVKKYRKIPTYKI